MSTPLPPAASHRAVFEGNAGGWGGRERESARESERERERDDDINTKKKKRDRVENRECRSYVHARVCIFLCDEQ